MTNLFDEHDWMAAEAYPLGCSKNVFQLPLAIMDSHAALI